MAIWDWAITPLVQVAESSAQEIFATMIRCSLKAESVYLDNAEQRKPILSGKGFAKTIEVSL